MDMRQVLHARTTKNYQYLQEFWPDNDDLKEELTRAEFDSITRLYKK